MLKNLAVELDEWRATLSELVPLERLTVHAALQPRDPSATRRRDAYYEQREIDRQVADFTLLLTTHASKELDALLVASINGELLVVDGHHRLAAYQRAGRCSAPVRARAMTMDRAVRLSRIVNLDGRNLALTKGQKSETLWQHLLDITNGGRRSLKQVGTNQRELAAAFGIGSKTTVANMQDRLELARTLRDGNSVPPEDRNPYTGYPTWWAVRRHLHPLEAETLSNNERHDKDVLNLAARMSAWCDRYSVDTVKAAFRLMMEQDDEDATELSAEITDF